MKHTFIFVSVLLFFFAAAQAQSPDRSGSPSPTHNAYLVPGFDEGSSALTTTATWTLLTPSPHAVSRSCCALITRNDSAFVYQFGGGSGAQFTNVAVYNVRAATWTNSVSTIPFQISAGYAINVQDSLIYVFGGNSPTLGKTLKYNVLANTWTTLPDMPSPVTDMLCVKYNDSLIYAICGGDGLFGTTTSNAVRLFNRNTNTWTSLTPFPISVSMIGGGIFRDTIIVTGGWTGTTGSPLSYKGVINPTNPNLITWTPIASYPTGGVTRMASHVVFKDGGVGIMCAGGAINGATVTNAANLWNFCTQTWQTLPTNTLARSNLRGTGKGDTTVYCPGGFTTVGVGQFDRIDFQVIDGTCGLVGIGSNENGVPSGFSLHQNYPNPFNPSTTIEYALPKGGLVRIVVADVLGREVKEIVNTVQAAGYHSVVFDAANLPSGVYFYRIEAGEFTDTKKMLLVK
jgi:hypothetical protein